MYDFKKGMPVVYLYRGIGGFEEATACKVSSVKKKIVTVDEFSTKFDMRGRSIEPSVFSGVSVSILPLCGVEK